MAGPTRQITTLELPWRTIVRVLLVCAFIWCLLRLTSLILLAIIAIIFAVTLDPIVRWLEGHRFARWGASSLVVFALMASIIGGAYLISTQLAQQSEVVGTHVLKAERDIVARIPKAWVGRISPDETTELLQHYVRETSLGIAQNMARALLLFILGAILTLYLLIEGRLTYAWMLAFVPTAKRRKVAQTAEECQRVILGYLAGNIATSIFATVFVCTTLSLLAVPGALLLAILAGVCDFVPVLGFALSGIPAVLSGLSISPATAMTVAMLYILYHTIENYLIAPRIYGNRLRLSNVAVVLAFAIGAELAGVVGALIALPIAAAYPAIERIWLREAIGPQVVEEHQAIEKGDLDEVVPPAQPKSA